MPIMQALVRNNEKKPIYKPREYPDIIVESYRTEEENYKDGTRVIKRVPVRVNLTKKINATAKLIKKESVSDIEAKLDEVFEVKKAEITKTLENEKAKLKREIKQ